MRSTLALRSFRSCDWYRKYKLLSVQKSFSQDCSVISHSFQAGVPDFGQQTWVSKLSSLIICATFIASYRLVFLVNFEHTLLSLSFIPLNTPFFFVKCALFLNYFTQFGARLWIVYAAASVHIFDSDCLCLVLFST